MLVHVSSTQYERVARHTQGSILDLVTQLEHAANHGIASHLSGLRQGIGFTYHAQRFMWDKLVIGQVGLTRGGAYRLVAHMCCFWWVRAV